MRTAMLFPVIFATLFATLMATAPAVLAKNYYKWTDDDGVTHYSARKPHGRDAEVVNITIGGVETSTSQANTTPQNSERQTKPTSQTTAKKDSLKDPERCENARTNLQVLLNSPKVRMRDENGEIYYLSEEEKAEKTREFEKAVEESC